MESYKTKIYQGRIYETKESFVVENVISEASKDSIKRVSIEEPSDFINKQLKDFNGKNVRVEVSIKVTEIQTTNKQ